MKPSGRWTQKNAANWRGYFSRKILFFVQQNTRCASNAKITWLFCKVCRKCASVCNLCQKNKKAMKSFDFTAFSGAMEGLEQGGGAQRRKQSHRAALLSLRVPTARNVYRGSCNRKIYGNKEERVRLIPRRFKTEKMKFHIDKTSRQVYNRTWKQQGITAKSARMPLWIETG